MSNEKEQLLMQLKGLREDCIKEHFEDKLEAIASKEVVHDILADFLSVNQD